MRQHSEEQRLKFNRKYFEDGCACIKNGALIILGGNVDDKKAVKYYEQNCRCSRNYESS